MSFRFLTTSTFRVQPARSSYSSLPRFHEFTVRSIARASPEANGKQPEGCKATILAKAGAIPCPAAKMAGWN
jgi:hypothetical protein